VRIIMLSTMAAPCGPRIRQQNSCGTRNRNLQRQRLALEWPMADQQIPGVSFVRVTNGLSEKIAGRYDGIDYLWKPGDAHDIPVAAAEHIFGFGVEDKAQAMNRLGWMPSSDKRDAAYEKLAMLGFDVVEQVFQLPSKR